MKTSSAKAKGRKLQQWVAATILGLFPTLESDDVQSRSMGAPGEDIMLSKEARRQLMVSIECKNQEKVNVWDSFGQARHNAKQYQPVLVIKRNHSDPLAVIDADYFFELLLYKYLYEPPEPRSKESKSEQAESNT